MKLGLAGEVWPLRSAKTKQSLLTSTCNTEFRTLNDKNKLFFKEKVKCWKFLV